VSSLASDPQLAPLWAAVHERLCRGAVTGTSIITVRDAPPETRRAVDRLLGRVSSAGQLKVRYDKLEAALRLADTDPRTVVTAAVGPVVDRTVARAESAAALSAAWDAIGGHPLASEPALRAWLERLRAAGRLARAGGPATVLRALDVLAMLPWDGPPVGRPVLAASVLGGEHDLDDGEPVARLVLAGLAARTAAPPPVDAAGRAALWAAAGVSLDSVSAPVLALGLRPAPAGPITEAAARWADSAVALPVPVAAVTAESWRLPAGTVVWVCENPSVLEAAAARYGAACPPVVCISGTPSRAAALLLASLTDGAARLRYHGDFGAGGLTIANLILARHSAEPWRMSTADHADAVARLASENRTPNVLRGTVPPASWDPSLAPAVVAYGYEVTEEHVLDVLLDDLAGSAS
jgi:uncharacterized protein (TIGR02679 family)